MTDQRKVVYGITQGDPNGVGMELILRIFSDENIYKYGIPVLYASPKTFTYYKKVLGLELPSYNLVKSAGEANYDFQILDAVMQVNETQKSILVPKIKAHFNGNLKGKHFAMWGLSFKPDTDDIREAPALYIIDALLAEGATVTAFDPEGMDNVKKLGKKIKFAPNPYEALEKSDALVICTEWSLFRNPDFSEMASKIASKTIFDGRNLYSVDQMKKLGFAYYSIGRKAIRKSKP